MEDFGPLKDEKTEEWRANKYNELDGLFQKHDIYLYWTQTMYNILAYTVG